MESSNGVAWVIVVDVVYPESFVTNGTNTSCRDPLCFELIVMFSAFKSIHIYSISHALACYPISPSVHNLNTRENR